MDSFPDRQPQKHFSLGSALSATCLLDLPCFHQPPSSSSDLELCWELFSLKFFQLDPYPQKQISQELIMPWVNENLVNGLKSFTRITSLGKEENKSGNDFSR